MRFTTAFVALLALTPVLCAPVPAPGSETVDSLARSANGDSAVLVKKLAPIAQEIVTLLGTMLPAEGADKSPVAPAPAAPSVSAPAPAAPATPASQPDAKDAAAAPAGGDKSPPAAQPETPNGAPNGEAATPTTPADSPAEPPASAAPTDAPNEGTVQRRAVDAPVAPESPATPTSTTAPAPSAPTTEIKPTDVYKLRTLLARATMYEQAIEQVLLAKGKNIEERPTSKTAGGVAWGLANGPIMAILGASGMVQKQPS